MQNISYWNWYCTVPYIDRAELSHQRFQAWICNYIPRYSIVVIAPQSLNFKGCLANPTVPMSGNGWVITPDKTISAFKVYSSQLLGWLYDCHNFSEATLKKYGSINHFNLLWNDINITLKKWNKTEPWAYVAGYSVKCLWTMEGWKLKKKILMWKSHMRNSSQFVSGSMCWSSFYIAAAD